MVNEAYRAFHNYSLGNQILAAMQLAAKGLRLSPIASFNGWKDKGRFVQKGQKALGLFMPVSVKRREVQGAAAGIVAGSGEDRGATFNVFVMRAHWFSLEPDRGRRLRARDDRADVGRRNRASQRGTGTCPDLVVNDVPFAESEVLREC